MPKRLLAALVAVVALAAAGAAAAATYAGEHAGSNYEIRVPDAGWNGTLVVLAHGYRDKADGPGEVDDRRALDDDFDLLADGLVAAGYAVAGTSYRDNGWAVKEMIHDLVAVRTLFNGVVGKPERALLVGFSLGTLGTGVLAERGEGHFDGFLPACGVLTGSPRAWGGSVDGLLAYDVAFGLPASWGTIGDSRDDVDFDTEVLPLMFGQLGDFARWEFIRLVGGAKGDGVALPLSLYPGWAFTNMYFYTEARAELERRAGGAFASNAGHVYSLSPLEHGYLAALGLNAQPLLDAMNARARVSGEPAPSNYVEQYATFSGKIKKPVLTLHTKWDTLVPAAHESAYAETVAAAGRSDLLLQTFSNGVGHCNFGTDIGAAVGLLDLWVRSGEKPSPALVAAFGLDPAYTPAPWPQP